MPMPKIHSKYWPSKDLYPNFEDRQFREHAVWQLQFMWWPARCYLSGRFIWLKTAYKGIRKVGSIVESNYEIYEYRYHDKIEHLIWLLKN